MTKALIARIRPSTPSAVGACAAALMALTSAGVAGAVDDTKPEPTCHGVLVTDSDRDGADTGPGGGRQSDASEIKSLFFKFDPPKAAQGATFNVVVKDLSTRVPQGASGMSWTVTYSNPQNQTRFVRAIVDFSGTAAFEHGTYYAPGESGPIGRFQAEGATPGKLFPGPDGVVQLVLPPDREGKPGTALKTIIVASHLNYQATPSAVPFSPTRGLSYEYDNASARNPVTVEPCTGPPPAGGSGPPPADPPASGSAPPAATQSQGRALPVKVLTTKAKRTKIKKTLRLKLRSSEPITGLAVQLRKGKKVVGKGSLKKVSGKGTVSLKVRGKLKKGGYVLDLVGSDAQGRRLFGAARLKVS